ncbi:AN1-type zinc finger protein 4, partial [Dissostichus eleginoides]
MTGNSRSSRSHALKPLLIPLAKTDTGLAASMCRVPHVAHITASNPGSSTSLHTTSGAVGPAPNSVGGLCGCTLRHISEKTLRRMKTARAG